MNFEWAVQQLKEGRKVRQKSWKSQKSYIFISPYGVLLSSIRGKAYFFLDSFLADDWELFDVKPKFSIGDMVECIAMQDLNLEGKGFVGSGYKLKRLFVIKGFRFVNEEFFYHDGNEFSGVYEPYLRKVDNFHCKKCDSKVKFGQKFCSECGEQQLWALLG